jgi:hypothetical protein
MRSSTYLLISLITLLINLLNCRGLDKTDTGPHDLNSEKIWYAADGNVQSCDRQPPTCQATGDPQPFVDSCVKQGFQAKSCGCFVLCSGAIKGFKLIEANQEKKASKLKDTCSASDQTVIKSVRDGRNPGTSLDRCLMSHVCNGRLGLCAGGDLATSTRLRDAARHGCADFVLAAICPAEFNDTFACPEKSVQLLSAIWTELRQKDVPTKRCIRNVVCSDRTSDCDQTSSAKAIEIKQTVDQPGCAYWLRGICAVGSQSW